MLTDIFGCLLSTYLNNTSNEVALTLDARKLLSITVKIYYELKMNFYPTPKKPHYIFTPRQLSNVKLNFNNNNF